MPQHCGYLLEREAAFSRPSMRPPGAIIDKDSAPPSDSVRGRWSERRSTWIAARGSLTRCEPPERESCRYIIFLKVLGSGRRKNREACG